MSDRFCHGVLNLGLVGHDQLFLLVVKFVVSGISLPFSSNYWLISLIEDIWLNGLLYYHHYFGLLISLYIGGAIYCLCSKARFATLIWWIGLVFIFGGLNNLCLMGVSG